MPPDGRIFSELINGALLGERTRLCQKFRSDKGSNHVNDNALVRQHVPPGVWSLRKVRLLLGPEVFCRHPSRIRGFCWRCADEFCDPQPRFGGSYMLVRGRLPYWLGSGSQSYLQSWSSPFTWMLRRRGPTAQPYVIPFAVHPLRRAVRLSPRRKLRCYRIALWRAPAT